MHAVTNTLPMGVHEVCGRPEIPGDLELRWLLCHLMCVIRTGGVARKLPDCCDT